MRKRKVPNVERRKGERRQKAIDARPDSEKGMIGERRSGHDRRGNEKVSQDAQQHWL